MKTLVTVIIYNRFPNLREWIRCWKMCSTENAELLILHNARNPNDIRTYKNLCQKSGIRYLSRPNVGFDIGAFQDVCRGRLPGFPEDFDFLLWCTDDLYPMKKDFIHRYLDKFTDGVMCVCYELSQEVHPHIRTTGFMLRKETLPKITFKVDPIKSKPECYDFEHRDRENALSDQINRLGKTVQVEDVETSCMWDTGLRSVAAKARRSRRQTEHIKAFR